MFLHLLRCAYTLHWPFLAPDASVCSRAHSLCMYLYLMLLQLELTAPNPLTVTRLVIDFATESAAEVFRKVSEAVDGLSVGVLVNNVGISYPQAMVSYTSTLPLVLLLLLAGGGTGGKHC